MTTNPITQLAQLLRAHPGAVALTGAGISTESGIPDFRSPGTGLYNFIDPMEYLSVDALMGRPTMFWKYFSEIFGTVIDVQPNSGHRALALLEKAGFISAIATQNIDGLHQKAGSKTVYEVHGHLRTARCGDCEKSWPLSEALKQVGEGKLPHCPECRGDLRPDVVLFGDMMPEAFSHALDAARAADLVLVVGSSLAVSPANMIAMQGGRVAIINREATPLDDRADVVIHGGAGEILMGVVAELGLK